MLQSISNTPARVFHVTIAVLTLSRRLRATTLHNANEIALYGDKRGSYD
ncbi:hypothetical protein HMPREF3190_00913 [Umbribacter vaginalis]|nr:hypothetical protein HMPREF3190_00913 [Coriobacteriales bacterium DNF00809]